MECCWVLKKVVKTAVSWGERRADLMEEMMVVMKEGRSGVRRAELMDKMMVVMKEDCSAERRAGRKVIATV